MESFFFSQGFENEKNVFLIEYIKSNNPAKIYLFKVAVESLEEGVSIFKVNNKNTRTTSMTFTSILSLNRLMLTGKR